MAEKSVAIVQARSGSSRLPGKVLCDIGGHTMLDEVLQRCKRIPGIDEVWCAVPKNNEDDKVAEVAREAEAFVFRGSEDDVLKRYADTAIAAAAAVVLRVTSDCPLIDPKVCGEVLALLKKTKADYACNNLRHEWAHGLDCEAFSIECLAEANKFADAAFDREHVTPWIRNNSAYRRVHLSPPDDKMKKYRWTVDTKEDLEFVRRIFPLIPKGENRFAYQVVCNVLERNPDLLLINAVQAGRSRPQSVSIV